MKKQYITFKCQHQRIERTDDFFVVGGSQRYLYAKFDFCSDWSDLQQYAVFTGDLQTYRIPIVDSECEVPWEMLLTKRFFVGCEAGQRITSNAVEVKVQPCGAPEETGTPRKPTPTLQSQIGDLSGLETEAKESLVAAINEVYGKQNDPEDVPVVPGEDGGYYTPSVLQSNENTIQVSFAASKEGMPIVPDQEITLPSGKDGQPGAAGKPGKDGPEGQPGKDGITPHIGANGNWFLGETDTGMPSRGEDAPQEAILYTPQDLTPEQQAQARANIGAVKAPETAEVGQSIVVKSVDENGKPTEWEAVDLPTGGGSGGGDFDERIIDFTTKEEVSEIRLPLTGISKKINNAAQIKLYIAIQKPSSVEGITASTTVSASFYSTWHNVILLNNFAAFPRHSYTTDAKILSIMTRMNGVQMVSTAVSGYVANLTSQPASVLNNGTPAYFDITDDNCLRIKSDAPMGVGTIIRLAVRGCLQ